MLQPTRKPNTKQRLAECALLVATAQIAFGAPAQANETTTYTYDALGRLIDSTRNGTVNSGVKVETSYDAAGNRINYKVTGSSNSQGGGIGGVIVLPLNGFTVIPLPGAGSYGL